MASDTGTSARLLDPVTGLDALIRALHADGYRVIAPVERDGVVVGAEVDSGSELPVGLRVEQAPGRWRSRHDGTGRRFAWTPAADSWKRWFVPPTERILTIRRQDGSFAVVAPEPPDRPLALIGVRDCELRGLAILDRVLAGGDHPDPRYVNRREGCFVVAVACAEPSATCWCTTLGGSPQPASGFDIALTEIGGQDDPTKDGDGDGDGDGSPHHRSSHRLVAVAGTDRGSDLLARLGLPPAAAVDLDAADRTVAEATDRIAARFDADRLLGAFDGAELHPLWGEVATRCLSCGNCTMVCPTCFCSTIEDHTGLPVGDPPAAPAKTERRQRWTSCFELDHSNLVGRPVRATTAARYRQWATHKLQTWHEQFGTSGCIGCGRCSAWCPAGIDLPAEAAALIGTSGGAR